MGKRPVFGLAAACLAGLALVGCQGSRNLCGGGKCGAGTEHPYKAPPTFTPPAAGAAGAAGAAAQPPAWNNTPAAKSGPGRSPGAGDLGMGATPIPGQQMVTPPAPPPAAGRGPAVVPGTPATGAGGLEQRPPMGAGFQDSAPQSAVPKAPGAATTEETRFHDVSPAAAAFPSAQVQNFAPPDVPAPPPPAPPPMRVPVTPTRFGQESMPSPAPYAAPPMPASPPPTPAMPAARPAMGTMPQDMPPTMPPYGQMQNQ